MEAYALLSLFDTSTATPDQLALLLGLMQEVYAYLDKHRCVCSVLVEVSASVRSPRVDLGIVFRDPALAGTVAWFQHQDPRSVRFSQATGQMCDPRLCQILFQRDGKLEIMREVQNRGITPETMHQLTADNLRKTAEAFVDSFFGGKPDLVEKLKDGRA